MDKLKIDDLLKKINFDDYYIEATFQFKLLMQLGKIYDEDKIFPERSIKAYNLKDYTKKEIDIVIEQENNLNIAMELKMPMNGQVPEQMFKFIEDIKFLEELGASKFFHKCYLIVVTKDKDFWQGNKNDGIYSSFRSNDTLKGKIYKPTGSIEIKVATSYELNGEYKIQWNNLVNGFRYFVIEIEYSATEQRDIKDLSLKSASEQIHSTTIFIPKNNEVLESKVINEKEYSGKKYLRLKKYLQSLDKSRIMLSHKEIEKILGDKLPESAYKYEEFWGNNRANNKDADHSNSWLEAGWEVEKIDLEHEVIFFRRKE